MTTDRSPLRADGVPPILLLPDHTEDAEKNAIAKPDAARQLVLGFVFGVVFGFLLQKVGGAKYEVLMGRFFLTDFTVIKLMLTAICRLRLRVLSTLLLASVAPFACAQEPPSSWTRWVQAINSTTPLPLGSAEKKHEGWLSGVWDGTKRIWNEGTQDLYLSGYVWHMPYGWSAEKREQFNDNAYGGGYGRTLTDDRDNQRMLYAMVASDSYHKPMVLVGYAWLARWPLAGEMRVGAGYSALIFRHESTAQFPIPLAAPVASIGNDNAALYVTYVHSMTYFFAKISFR